MRNRVEPLRELLTGKFDESTLGTLYRGGHRHRIGRALASAAPAPHE